MLNGLVGSGGEQRKDSRAEAGGNARGHQHRLVEHVGVDLVEHFALLRNASSVDHAIDFHAVFGHALENDAGVEGGALDGGKQLVLRGVNQVPTERNAAQFGIDQHGAVAVVPAQAQESGLPGLVALQPFRELATVELARRAMASKMSPVAERPASMPV